MNDNELTRPDIPYGILCMTKWRPCSIPQKKITIPVPNGKPDSKPPIFGFFSEIQTRPKTARIEIIVLIIIKYIDNYFKL